MKLAGQCTAYSSDVMLYVRETNLATYPDGSVVCGPTDAQQVIRNGKVIGEAITNPTIVLEVLRIRPRAMTAVRSLRTTFAFLP